MRDSEDSWDEVLVHSLIDLLAASTVDYSVHWSVPFVGRKVGWFVKGSVGAIVGWLIDSSALSLLSWFVGKAIGGFRLDLR